MSAPEMPAHGLTEREAALRLAREGPNVLPDLQRRSRWRIIVEVLKEPMFALLLGAAVLYAFLGELSDTLVLLAFACFSVAIAVVQESRSERVLEALRDLSTPRALVVRDDDRRRIPGSEVVRGDLLVIGAGDRIPADAVVVTANDLHVDESVLSGESVPVRKVAFEGVVASEGPTPDAGGDDSPYVFSGTLIVRGTGLAVVAATGPRSQIGRIGRAIGEITTEKPRLQAQTQRVVLVAAIAGGVVSILAGLLYGLIHGDWLQAILAGIALGMSVLPEEFPLVLTVFMVMGAWRLSKANVLTRRSAAIETLGAATVLCTDKTGTLTENRMGVAFVGAAGAQWGFQRSRGSHASQGSQRAEADEGLAATPALTGIVVAAALASPPESADPMDRAVTALAKSVLSKTARAKGLATATDHAFVRLYPLQSDLLAVTCVWRTQTAAAPAMVAASKGAPEAVAHLCRLSPTERAGMLAEVDSLCAQGLRVLAVARCQFQSNELPDSPRDLLFEYLGLVGFADPVREGVPHAVDECRAAGIRVVMITGDYPITARAIARQAHINHDAVLSGAELTGMDDAMLRREVERVDVFARIMPQQKLRIVEAFKANGEVVAMTGDGVNDAPALKAAHIGIAMGGRGTDVAREAASLVLLNDDFSSLVRGVRYGRRIYDNLRKAMAFIIAIHVPIAGLALLTIVLGQQLLLTPMLIAFLEMIIDPACSVVLEAEREERDVMTRPPRDPRSRLMSKSMIVWGLWQGCLGLLIVSAAFLVANSTRQAFSEVRTVTFVSLVLTILVLVLANRSFSSSMISAFRLTNPALWWGFAVAAGALAVTLSVGGLRDFLGLAALRLEDLGGCLAMGLVLLGTLEILKRVRHPT